MAIKKASSSAKKTSKKSTNATTKVTTVKAVEPRPMAASTTAVMNKFSLKNSSAVSALIAEFIGTFALAAAVIAGQGQPIIVLFALVGVVLTVGTLSGGYVNPALTIAAWVTRRLTGLRALGYIIAQFLGAALALTLLNTFVNAAPAPAADAASLYSSAPALFQASAIPESKEWLIFLAELVGASVFGFAVAGATREIKERTAAAFTVGLGIFLGLMLAGSAAAFIGGTPILNPAVAVSLQAINFGSIWPILVYVIGASLGAVIGFVLHDLLRSAENK